MKDKFCEANIHSGWNSYKCKKPAKVEFEGKYYCGIHDPIKKKKIGDIRQKMYEEKFKIQQEAWHRLELMKTILGKKTTKELEEMATHPHNRGKEC